MWNLIRETLSKFNSDHRHKWVTNEAEIDQPTKFNLLVFSDFGKLGRTNMVSNCYLKRRSMITTESYLILLALIASPIWWISGVSNLSILLMQSALHLLSKMTPRLHWGHFFDFNKWSKVHLNCLIPPSSEIFILNDPMDLGFIFMSIITPSISIVTHFMKRIELQSRSPTSIVGVLMFSITQLLKNKK